MRATVSVCRIGYGHLDLDIEIPDKELVGLSEKETVEVFENRATDMAGNHVFSGYIANGVTLHVQEGVPQN